MKVYLDGMFYRSTGLGRLYEQLLTLLTSEPWVSGIVTAVPAAARERFAAELAAPGVRALFMPFQPMGLADLVHKTRLLRRLAGEVSLFVYPGSNVPLFAPRADLVGVNDTIPFGGLLPIAAPKIVAFRWLLASTIRRARSVVTLSAAARADVIRLFPAADGKIHVIPPWVERSFFEVAGAGERAESAPAERHLLFLGRRARHKNLSALLAAFEQLAPEFPRLRLVVAGPRVTGNDELDTWRATSPFKARVQEVLAPDDERVHELFAGAGVFVFPSRAEGFGLPPLEAMAAGVPVVCSDLPVLREVYGDAVRYIDPHRPDRIAAAVRELLLDAGLRTELCRAGRERAAHYTRANSEHLYRELLRSLAGQT
jgi:glycosyltransferase involved in cell wall biosynthesis